jgi:hypothetical protein
MRNYKPILFLLILFLVIIFIAIIYKKRMFESFTAMNMAPTTNTSTPVTNIAPASQSVSFPKPSASDNNMSIISQALSIST